MQTRVVTLGFSKAIEAIKDRDEVFYKHGVWNKYSRVSVKSAIEGIEKSGYGADTFTMTMKKMNIMCLCLVTAICGKRR